MSGKTSTDRKIVGCFALGTKKWRLFPDRQAIPASSRSLKGIFHEVHVWLQPLLEDNLNDIVAPGNHSSDVLLGFRFEFPPQKPQPFRGSPHNQRLFFNIHGPQWAPKIPSSSSFYFNKDEKVQIPPASKDQIHLAAFRRAKVSIQQFPAPALEKSGGDLFSQLPDFPWCALTQAEG